MIEKSTMPATTIKHVYLIIVLFVALIIILISLIQVQMNALMGIRGYIGAEGIWAKAQKDATRSLEHYAVSHNENDYNSYLRFIQVPLGDKKARIEMQKPIPNMEIAREGFLVGGNHPDDLSYMINLFLQFQHVSFMSEAIVHWTEGDIYIDKLNEEANLLHHRITSGDKLQIPIIQTLQKLDDINQQLTIHENQFSLTLAESSRWASKISRNFTYAISFIFSVIGIAISWFIAVRIRSTESALFRSEENLRTILDVSPIAVRIASNHGRKVVFYNRSYSNLIKNTSALNDDPRNYYARPADYDEILDEIERGNSVINRQIELNVHGTSSIWTLASFMPIQHLGEEAVLGWFLDISHIKDHEAELSRIAHFDGLTGIPNRLLLADRMNQAIAQTSRDKNMMAVCYLDLDGFKPINDVLGHAAGDLVLIEIAKRIEKCIRGGDTVARLGGDEFVVLLLGQEKGHESLATLERLLAAISEPIIVKNKSVTVSASIGVSIYPLDDEDPDTLLRHADQSMYLAKQSGKSRFHIYDPAVDRNARDQNEFLKSFRFGLENRQLELYYQPKVNLKTKQMVGVEALIRWNHPQRGLLPPSEFLRLIENTELEIKVGEWVIATALAQMNEWQKSGLDIEVSINISGYHLESFDFFAKLQKQLSNFPDSLFGRLQIEVLETVALNDIAVVRETINLCRNLGISFALDDFGTGYSSLSYLNSLPFDTLKIDQSFVRDMLEDKGDRAIVQGIIALAKAFERQTVAEGIETETHYQMLIDLGCELGQGYGIAKPMPAKEIMNWQSTYGKR